MAHKRLKHEAYTVAWVCALPKEQTAAIAMLDEMHADLSKPPNDPNAYTLGSIYGHNIAIACLPTGRIGLAPAATVASHMVSTFPSLRFALMVGIGGGIPPKVRLGDVVVGVPSGEFPGVVQWDMGKVEQDELTRTGALNNPPTLLLTALTKLISKHEYEGSRIPEHLKALANKYPRLAARYSRSELLQDLLFRTKCRHESKARKGQDESVTLHSEQVENDEEIYEYEEENESCRYCDATQIIHRKPREMKVHYGTIASGNKVIKSAVFRDKLVRFLGGGILCVEMEAAGLMNNVSCLVIRGICDYADAHKNKAWQEHAAAVAAAFAKELLEVVDAKELEEEAVLKDMSDKISHLIHSMDTAQERIQRCEILEWMASDAYGRRQSDTLRQWHPETAHWFLSSKAFQNWLGANRGTLYSPGIAGAGKTIINSVVIEHLHNLFPKGSKIGIGYIYCMFSQQSEQTLENMLGSLLRQLTSGLPSIPQNVVEAYQVYERQCRYPRHTELYKLLRCVIAEYEKVFFITDALDECSAHEGKREMFLDTLFELQLDFDLNIFATSRIDGDMKEYFIAHNAAILPIHARDEDLKSFLENRMRFNGSDLLDDALRCRAVEEIVQVSNGMFLLAKLHMDDIASLPTKGDVKQFLNNPVKRLDSLFPKYELAMKRISDRGRGYSDLAMRLLTWIVCARRELRPLEVQHALATKTNFRTFDRDYLPSTALLTSLCAGLVTIDEESDIIRLNHHSVREYFDQTKDRWFPEAHTIIAKTCITYLSVEDCSISHRQSIREIGKLLASHPFSFYAADFWSVHAHAAGASSDDMVSSIHELAQACGSVERFLNYYLYVKRAFPPSTNISELLRKRMTAKALIEVHPQEGPADVWGETSDLIIQNTEEGDMSYRANQREQIDENPVIIEMQPIRKESPLGVAAKGEKTTSILRAAEETGVNSFDMQTKWNPAAGEQRLAAEAIVHFGENDNSPLQYDAAGSELDDISKPNHKIQNSYLTKEQIQTPPATINTNDLVLPNTRRPVKNLELENWPRRLHSAHDMKRGTAYIGFSRCYIPTDHQDTRQLFKFGCTTRSKVRRGSQCPVFSNFSLVETVTSLDIYELEWLLNAYLRPNNVSFYCTVCCRSHGEWFLCTQEEAVEALKIWRYVVEFRMRIKINSRVVVPM